MDVNDIADLLELLRQVCELPAAHGCPDLPKLSRIEQVASDKTFQQDLLDEIRSREMESRFEVLLELYYNCCKPNAVRTAQLMKKTNPYITDRDVKNVIRHAPVEKKITGDFLC